MKFVLLKMTQRGKELDLMLMKFTHQQHVKLLGLYHDFQYGEETV